MKDSLAIVGGLIAAFSTLPYLIDIVRRKSKPNIVTWSTWTLLTGIASAAAFAAGEYRTAFLVLGGTICTGLVALLGLKYGIAKMTWFDGLCQLGAIAGLILWLIFSSPSIAIAFTLAIDFIVMLPTLRHCWVSPQEETWQTYVVGIVAALCTVASLVDYNFVSLTFPLYLIAADGVLAAVIVARRRQKGLALAR